MAGGQDEAVGEGLHGERDARGASASRGGLANRIYARDISKQTSRRGWYAPALIPEMVLEILSF